jgi:hypothetical protein
MGRSFEEQPVDTPAGTRPPSDAPTFGRASTSASVGAAEPAPHPPVTAAELLDTLAEHGLLDPVDLEWELTQRLEELS